MSWASVDKDSVIDIIAAAVSFIPFCGDQIGSGITIICGFRKLFKDATKANKIIDAIQKGIRCGDLNEEDAKSVCVAIQGVLHEKKTDLLSIARNDDLIQNLKNDIFKASDHRKESEYEYKQYISDAVMCMISPEILPLFANCDQIAVENLHEIRELYESNDLIYRRLDKLENRVNDIEKIVSSKHLKARPTIRNILIALMNRCFWKKMMTAR